MNYCDDNYFYHLMKQFLDQNQNPKFYIKLDWFHAPNHKVTKLFTWKESEHENVQFRKAQNYSSYQAEISGSKYRQLW